MAHFKLYDVGLGSMLVLAVVAKSCSSGAGITCQTLRQYSPEFQARVVVQMGKIETIAPDVVTVVNDTGVDRDAIRKCLALQKKAKK